jgi:hypothetical protein
MMPESERNALSFHVQIQFGMLQIKPKLTSDKAIRQKVRRVLSYSTNVLDIIPYQYRNYIKNSDKITDDITYGVELETSSRLNASKLIDAQKTLFFACKQDGSISGSFDNRNELVTVPATLKQQKRLWASFFDNVNYADFDCSARTTNGMHVHISRDAFSQHLTNLHLQQFTFFFIRPSNRDFIYKISERDQVHHMVQYSGFPEVTGKRKNLEKALDSNGNMRGAINLRKGPTIEVRIFKGLVSYATIAKNLEFVDALVEYTRPKHSGYSTLTSYHFIQWLNSLEPSRYRILRQFIFKHFNPRNLEIHQKFSKVIDIACGKMTSDHLYRPLSHTLFLERLNGIQNVSSEEIKYITNLFPQDIGFNPLLGKFVRGTNKAAILGDMDLPLQAMYAKNQKEIKPVVSYNSMPQPF